MSASGSANNEPNVSRSLARQTVRAALRMFIGRGKRFSVKQASNGSGVPDRVIECAMCEPDHPDYRAPPIEALLSLAGFLGPEFTCEWTKLAQQGAFWLPDVDDTPPGELAADATEDAAAIARRAADGDLDREDRAQLRPVGLRMVATGAKLAFG